MRNRRARTVQILLPFLLVAPAAVRSQDTPPPAAAPASAPAEAPAQAPASTPAEAPPPDKDSATNIHIVVSATKQPEDAIDVPGSTSVIRGEDLQRLGALTLSDAIQDVVGLDTGDGSDNGSLVPNIGMWGLKEFDALLVTVDGIPIGGPFNPSLTQIPVEDIDRIEIVKGPQGTLYGVSAFAGMVQVFTKAPHGGISGTFGGGSMGDFHGSVDWSGSLSDNSKLRLSASTRHLDGWQDRTDAGIDRLTASYESKLGAGNLHLFLDLFQDKEDWGSPTPYDAGEIVEGFDPEANYAVGGALVDHSVIGLHGNYDVPLSTTWHLQNSLGIAYDKQKFIRSFILGIDGDMAEADGVQLEPEETTVFDDFRLLKDLQAAGAHKLLLGAAATFGKTRGDGHGFEFEFEVSPNPDIPDLDELPVRDDRFFEDMRLFLGLYVHDEWTPTRRLTISGGARLDHTSEELEAEGGEEEERGLVALAEEGEEEKQKRDDTKPSGDLAVLYRVVDKGQGSLQVANVYAAIKHNFKPAAPNLSEAEEAHILEPETTDSIEGGIKTRWMKDQLGIDVSAFDMSFKNLVVSILGSSGGPELVNAGEESFSGFELAAEYRPNRFHGLTIQGGYAHHSPKFEEFTFVTPDGELRDVSGNFLELAPRDLFNLRAMYSPDRGIGGFVAWRYQGERFLNRRNTFTADAFSEFDAGASYGFSWGVVRVIGRNLSDDRHLVSESEIGDSQFYTAPPFRVTAEVGFHF